MADLPNPTQDVTLFDNESDNYADITDDNELSVLDAQSLAELVEILKATKNIHYYQEYEQAFYVTYQATLTSKDTLYPIILFHNPSASGKEFEIQHIDISAVAVSTGAYVKIRLYSNPTVTANGTALTQVNATVGSVVTSGINIYSVPTISANGDLMSYQASQLMQPYRVEHWLGTGLLEDNRILLSAEATSNGTVISVTVKYVSYDD
jgi:hypothetical protein